MEKAKITENSLRKLLGEYVNDKEQGELQEKMFHLIQSWECFDAKGKKEIEFTMTGVLRSYLPYIISDIERLKHYWDHSSAGSKPRELIESRMAEILASINCAEEWFYFWENVPCDSQIGKMSDGERAEMLRWHLSNTDDMSELICFLESVRYWRKGSLQEKLINDRIIEVLIVQLPSIDGIGELAHLWRSMRVDSEPKKLIEDRIVEVLSIQLPSIDDMDKLMFLWENVPSDSFLLGPCSLRGLIEDRMANILPNCLLSTSEIDKLIIFWKHVSTNSKPRKLIEDRMAEVLSTQLLCINDMPELKCLWERISFPRQISVNSKPREMIEYRMFEVLERVNLENTPSWFVDILRKKFFLPDSLEEYFLKKVKSLTERS